MTAARVGWTRYFDAQRGYGFLKDVESGEEVFVHYSSLQSQRRARRWLYKGEYVCYSPLTDQQGRRSAMEVTGVAGGPLMCEAPGMDDPEFA